MTGKILVAGAFGAMLLEEAYRIIAAREKGVWEKDFKGVTVCFTAQFHEGEFEMIAAEMTGDMKKPRTLDLIPMGIFTAIENGCIYEPYIDEDDKLSPMAQDIMFSIESAMGFERDPVDKVA